MLYETTGASKNTVNVTLTSILHHSRALRGRSALQVLGSAAAALDRLPRGAEQATSGKSCG